MGSYSSALTADVEDFNAIVSLIERRNPSPPQPYLTDQTPSEAHLSTSSTEPESPKMAEEKQEPDLDLLKFLINHSDTPSSANMDSLPLSPAGLPLLLPESIVAALRTPATEPERRPVRQGPATMEQLKLELRDVRDQLELLKSQHKKEIKLLMNELDEEKKMRLSLQVEVDHIKKQMSKQQST